MRLACERSWPLVLVNTDARRRSHATFWLRPRVMLAYRGDACHARVHKCRSLLYVHSATMTVLYRGTCCGFVAFLLSWLSWPIVRHLDQSDFLKMMHEEGNAAKILAIPHTQCGMIAFVRLLRFRIRVQLVCDLFEHKEFTRHDVCVHDSAMCRFSPHQLHVRHIVYDRGAEIYITSRSLFQMPDIPRAFLGSGAVVRALQSSASSCATFTLGFA